MTVLLQMLKDQDSALKRKLLSKDCPTPGKRSKDHNQELDQVIKERDALRKKVEALTKEIGSLKGKLKAYEPSAEDATELASNLRYSLMSKMQKAMSVWKKSCNRNGARFNVEVACMPPVLNALIGDTLYTAATKGAKAKNASIAVNLNTEEKICSVFGSVPYGSVRYASLSLKVGGTSGIKLKLDKATNTLVVSGVYGKNTWDE